tara:strand:- start:415 stop:864 length:450 start_codon:yes stop_codon:yes gene_type:complete
MNYSNTRNAFEGQNNINEKIYSRNLPNFNPEIKYSIPSQPTRYSKYHLIDKVKFCPIDNNKEIYCIGSHFNPGQKGPYTGYVSSVDVESSLKNINFALQNSPYSEYVPSSRSMLYSKDNPIIFSNEYNNVLKKTTFNESTRQNILNDLK